MKFNIKNSYVSKLSYHDTLLAKEEIRKGLKSELAKKFKLIEVEPAIITDNNIWLNDDFNSTERPVSFDTMDNIFGQVVQSNIKFRRKVINDLEIIDSNSGVLTDGLFVRRDRQTSNISAVSYNEIGFDISRKNPTIDDVKDILIDFYAILMNVDKKVSNNYKDITADHLDPEVTLITNIQLKTLYPLLSFGERIQAFGKDKGNFILYDFINSMLDTKEGGKYSQDTYDFDTYCELYVSNKTIQQTICIAGAGVQVDREKLKQQTEMLREDWKGSTEYELLIKSSELPDTISLSCDFSRIAMTILEKQHIAEVISSVWNSEFIEYVNQNRIKIM